MRLIGLDETRNRSGTKFSESFVCLKMSVENEVLRFMRLINSPRCGRVRDVSDVVGASLEAAQFVLDECPDLSTAARSIGRPELAPALEAKDATAHVALVNGLKELVDEATFGPYARAVRACLRGELDATARCVLLSELVGRLLVRRGDDARALGGHRFEIAGTDRRSTRAAAVGNARRALARLRVRALPTAFVNGDDHALRQVFAALAVELQPRPRGARKLDTPRPALLPQPAQKAELPQQASEPLKPPPPTPKPFEPKLPQPDELSETTLSSQVRPALGRCDDEAAVRRRLARAGLTVPVGIECWLKDPALNGALLCELALRRGTSSELVKRGVARRPSSAASARRRHHAALEALGKTGDFWPVVASVIDVPDAIDTAQRSWRLPYDSSRRLDLAQALCDLFCKTGEVWDLDFSDGVLLCSLALRLTRLKLHFFRRPTTPQLKVANLVKALNVFADWHPPLGWKHRNVAHKILHHDWGAIMPLLDDIRRVRMGLKADAAKPGFRPPLALPPPRQPPPPLTHHIPEDDIFPRWPGAPPTWPLDAHPALPPLPSHDDVA